MFFQFLNMRRTDAHFHTLNVWVVYNSVADSFLVQRNLTISYLKGFSITPHILWVYNKPMLGSTMLPLANPETYLFTDNVVLIMSIICPLLFKNGGLLPNCPRIFNRKTKGSINIYPKDKRVSLTLFVQIQNKI